MSSTQPTPHQDHLDETARAIYEKLTTLPLEDQNTVILATIESLLDNRARLISQHEEVILAANIQIKEIRKINQTLADILTGKTHTQNPKP